MNTDTQILWMKINTLSGASALTVTLLELVKDWMQVGILALTLISMGIGIYKSLQKKKGS